MKSDDYELARQMIDKISDIGRIEILLKEVLDNELFDDLSKHNPYWQDTEQAKAEDRLYQIRWKLSAIKDGLWSVMEVINKDYSL